MKHVLTLLMVSAFAVCALGATGCVVEDDPAEAACEDFDYYLSICHVECGTVPECEYRYDTASYSTQLDLDECSSCLADEADLETCHDCTYEGGHSCLALLDNELHVDCTW
jgi:hypothetical protein